MFCHQVRPKIGPLWIQGRITMTLAFSPASAQRYSVKMWMLHHGQKINSLSGRDGITSIPYLSWSIAWIIMIIIMKMINSLSGWDGMTSILSSLLDHWIVSNKTISDGGLTVDFWIIKVHTSIWSSNSWGSSNSWDHRIVGDHRVPLDLSFEMIILKKPCNHPGNI